MSTYPITVKMACLECGTETSFVAELTINHENQPSPVPAREFNVPHSLPCCGLGCKSVYTHADLMDEAEAEADRLEQERKVEESIKEAIDNEPR